jgi:long-chain acyl-CoA synthetase
VIAELATQNTYLERRRAMDRPWFKEYEKGVPTSIDYPQVPVQQFLIDTAAKYPNRSALVFGNVVKPLGNRLMDTQMSYAQLLAAAERFAAVLQKLGVQEGDRVAVHLPNCPQFIIAYYATLMVGGIVVPCNPQYVAREIRHQLSDSGSQGSHHLSLTYPLVKQVRAETPVEHVIVANIKEYFPGLLKFLFTAAVEKKEGHFQDISGDANTYWFQDLLAQAPAKPTPVTVSPDDTGVLMYTGGTTGVSKGAQLTHRNMVANASRYATGCRPIKRARRS